MNALMEVDFQFCDSGCYMILLKKKLRSRDGTKITRYFPVNEKVQKYEPKYDTQIHEIFINYDMIK